MEPLRTNESGVDDVTGMHHAVWTDFEWKPEAERKRGGQSMPRILPVGARSGGGKPHEACVVPMVVGTTLGDDVASGTLTPFWNPSGSLR